MKIEIHKTGLFRTRFFFRIVNNSGKVITKSVKYKRQHEIEGVISMLKHTMRTMTIYRQWEWND